MFHINPTAGKSQLNMPEYVVEEDHQYQTPVKCVKTIQDMQLWEKSEAYFEYLGFILAINESVRGRGITSSEAENFSPVVKNVVNLLSRLSELIDQTPPVSQPQRFGNKAFREFYQKLKDRAVDLIKEVLPVHLYRAIPEIMFYLVDGFGNPTRIDYGTGHEISFLMFVCCLFKIGALEQTDKAAVALAITAEYLTVVRKLQFAYRMEPAGSHGVWSLDDYQFVPFIWGSAQLIGHPVLDPTSFLNEELVRDYAPQYLFMSCIEYINKVKKGPFAEHSNQLWGISGVSSWAKVNGGLVKMYKVEVLAKFPVVQHMVFGSLLPIKPAEVNSMVRKTRMSSSPPISPFSSCSELTEIQTLARQGKNHDKPDDKDKTSSSTSLPRTDELKLNKI